MGHNDHFDFDLHEAIEDLLDEGYIEQGSAAYGIAQKVIHEGDDGLTEKQRFVYERDVIPALIKRGEELRIIQIQNSWPE